MREKRVEARMIAGISTQTIAIQREIGRTRRSDCVKRKGKERVGEVRSERWREITP
jgi:hypothetical protein